MASNLSKKGLKRLLDSLEEQGCTIRPLSNGGGGYRVLSPDGVHQYSIHLSVSDWRGLKNLRSEMRRDGLTWPEGVMK